MDVIKTAIEGVVIIEPKVFKDSRGYFLRAFPRESLKKKFVGSILYRTTNQCQAMA